MKERRYYSIYEKCPECGACRIGDDDAGLADKGQGKNRIVYCRCCGWMQQRPAATTGGVN